MSDALEILKKINWFIEPVSDFIIFLFSTKSGFAILVVLLFGYLVFPVFDELKKRRLAYKAATSYTGSKLTFAEKLYVTGNIIIGRIGNIVTKAPVLLISLLLLMMFVTVSKSITAINEFVDNRNKIDELTAVVKQLDKRYKVADVEITDYNPTQNLTTLKIIFTENTLSADSSKIQTISVKGNDIFFDAIVVNFDFSKIIEGGVRNLVLPYRISSNVVPSAQGVLLNYKDKNGIPLIYKRNENEIYGMTKEKYDARLAEFAQLLTDEKKAREAGIRSMVGNAVHKKIVKGEKLQIWVEQTGGLVIKQNTDF